MRPYIKLELLKVFMELLKAIIVVYCKNFLVANANAVISFSILFTINQQYIDYLVHSFN